MINDNTLIEKIKQTIEYNYDFRILLFLAGEVMEDFENVDLSDDFHPLLTYFDTFACSDQVVFKQVIDFLYKISIERKINSLDIDYILNKKEIDKFIKAYQSKFISDEIYDKLLNKYFYEVDLHKIKEYLKNI